jgi:hypothetical protein
MIALLAGHDRRAFGVASALDSEGIAYDRAGDPDADVLVVAREQVDAHVVARAMAARTVIVGSSSALSDALFDADGAVDEGPATLSLDEPIWPSRVRALAAEFGVRQLAVPRAASVVPARMPRGDVLATLVRVDGTRLPAVVAAEGHAWSLLDLGSALADLQDETYFPEPAYWPVSRLVRPALALYYRAPDVIRRRLHRWVYAVTAARARRHLAITSSYPIDLTGWLLLELFGAVLRCAADELVRLGRWPAPWTAAAVVTHDLEPTRFAYTRGLSRLLRRARRPLSVGVVARRGRHLSPAVRRRLADAEVYCHGLTHRGEDLMRGADDVAAVVATARRELAALFARPIEGFRSPRLDRGPGLLAALDRVGFRFDSSYPDVDRENPLHFGAGVRLNLPFRPPIPAADGSVRPSRCLELPVTAPDCVQPLFLGDRPSQLGAAVARKCRFVAAIGGLYVAIIHAGVFGDRDVARRSAHLGFLMRRLTTAGMWLTSASALTDWWEAREAVRVTRLPDGLMLENRGTRAVGPLRVFVDRHADTTTYVVPIIAPGTVARLAIGPAVVVTPARAATSA